MSLFSSRQDVNFLLNRNGNPVNGTLVNDTNYNKSGLNLISMSSSSINSTTRQGLPVSSRLQFQGIPQPGTTNYGSARGQRLAPPSEIGSSRVTAAAQSFQQSRAFNQQIEQLQNPSKEKILEDYHKYRTSNGGKYANVRIGKLDQGLAAFQAMEQMNQSGLINPNINDRGFVTFLVAPISSKQNEKGAPSSTDVIVPRSNRKPVGNQHLGASNISIGRGVRFDSTEDVRPLYPERYDGISKDKNLTVFPTTTPVFHSADDNQYEPYEYRNMMFSHINDPTNSLNRDCVKQPFSFIDRSKNLGVSLFKQSQPKNVDPSGLRKQTDFSVNKIHDPAYYGPDRAVLNSLPPPEYKGAAITSIKRNDLSVGSYSKHTAEADIPLSQRLVLKRAKPYEHPIKLDYIQPRRGKQPDALDLETSPFTRTNVFVPTSTINTRE